ncbi:helix-turn-helix domain-containing protein [Aestuariivivens marinum]|uniref:helix-turn-helix domain-containing protein n=1 Tax=Aestuariivivens marinum TaxID=2913555 RepID=UPI001F59E5E2|nr:AraC family transcriptional regulator [Aestuariivivens marinum]
MTNNIYSHTEPSAIIYSKPSQNIIMALETGDYLHRLKDNQFDLFHQKFHNSTQKIIEKFNGNILSLKDNSYIVSFNSTNDTIFCAIKIYGNLNYITPNFDPTYRQLKIGVSLIPTLLEGNVFKEAVAHTIKLCEYVKGDIIITSGVKHLYENNNKNDFLHNEHIRLLKPKEERFLSKLILFIEKNWNDPTLDVSAFSKSIGYSKSQLNRNLKGLTGKSPNQFIRAFRLHKALELLYNQKGNISEIAHRTGFNNSTYFTKCFYDNYGLLPSNYLQKHVYCN